MIDDECVSCPVGQSRDPTDPTRCFAYRCGDLNADEINRVCGSQGRIIDNDHYVNEQRECCTSCDGQLVRDPTDPTRCTTLSTTMVQDVTIPGGGLGGPSVTTPTPLTGEPVSDIRGTRTRPTRPTRDRPETTGPTCGQQYPDYDQDRGQTICTSISPVYGGEPIWRPNNEYVLTRDSRNETEYFYNTCCLPESAQTCSSSLLETYPDYDSWTSEQISAVICSLYGPVNTTWNGDASYNGTIVYNEGVRLPSDYIEQCCL